ncbi:MAG: hypothetical protein J6Z44_00565 [Bacteroidales bacterium]|nr:hypothetical protein [Bacteroidales bacterium]
MKHFDDITDDEIRIIGGEKHPVTSPRKPFWRQWWFWAAIVVAILLIALSFLTARKDAHYHFSNGTIKEVTSDDEGVLSYIVECEPATALVRDTIINDVPLRIITPMNAMPELVVGIPDTTDKSLVLALQAADIRADNHGIVGAFVLKGDLLSRGIAKKGYCAIFNWETHLGTAESTPLFEEAINNEGYFFRQYPLVCDGRMVENNPKNKALRHALCELDGHIVTVSSLDKESFHDFAQALEDLGVENALALTGADAYGFLRNDEGALQSWGDIRTWQNAPNVNFIVWRRAE